MHKLLIILFILCSHIILAKDYQVKLQVTNLPTDTKPVLLRIYNGNLFVVDSTAIRENNNVIFPIPANTSPGMFKVLLGMNSRNPGMPPSLPVTTDFLFNHENITLKLDFNDPANTIEVIESKENKLYFDFLKSDIRFYQKLGLLEQIVISYPEKDEFYQKALECYNKAQHEHNQFIDETYKSAQKSLAARMIKNQKIPIIPGKLTPEQRDSIFRNEFLSQIDFSDTTLLYTNIYTDKIFQYIKMCMKETMSPRENEANCIRAIDYIVPLLNVNPIVQQHLLHFLIAGFESTMHMEEVLAHISSNYLQQCGSSSEVVKRRLEGYRRMAIGEKVPDLNLIDIQGTPFNLYSDVTPYTLILFWHTACSHCQFLMKQLAVLDQKGLFSNQQVKIIGISIDDNKEEWEKFTANYPLKWVNTYTEGSFESPVASDYNLFATPTMFLINSEHRIIAKPTTSGELEKDINSL